MTEIRKAIIVGTLGSVWFQTVFFLIDRTFSFSKLIYVILLSMIITFLILKLFKKSYLALAPSLWLIVNDLIFTKLDFNYMFTTSIPNGILVGLPIGITLYYFTYIKGYIK